MTTSVLRLRTTELATSPRPIFAEVCTAHLDAVYRYLLQTVRHPQLAEDLASETFERALRHWASFDPRRGSALGWLVRIARNAALDHFRSERRRREREERAATPERQEPREPGGLSVDLKAALGALSDAEREVIALRVMLDLDSAEAAAVMGISPTNCSTLLHRAMTKLRREVVSA